VCSRRGGRCTKIEEVRQREVRKYQIIVVVEFYRVRCPSCGLKVETVSQLPSKAPFSKDFEDAVGMACESAAARQFGLAAATVRFIDKRVFGALGAESEATSAPADVWMKSIRANRRSS
jgi:hypothetical protein